MYKCIVCKGKKRFTILGRSPLLRGPNVALSGWMRRCHGQSRQLWQWRPTRSGEEDHIQTDQDVQGRADKYKLSGADGEQGGAHHCDRTQPNTAAARLHREGGEASPGDHLCHHLGDHHHGHVAGGVRPREEEKGEAAAMRRVPHPRGCRQLPFSQISKLSRSSLSPSPMTRSTCWHREVPRTISWSTSSGRRAR